MRPVSQRFLTTLSGSHTFAARARVCTTWQTGTQPTGVEIDIIDGQVQLDGTAEIRSTLSMTTDGTGMWPRLASDLLAPYGNEIFVERGVQYNNATFEWCSLGYFRLNTPGQDSPPDGPIRLEGKDRMAGVIDARMISPIQIAANATYGAVMNLLIHDVYPAATIEWDDATDIDTVGRSVIVEEDRFKFLDELITSLGKVWYWDHRGVLVIRDPPVATSPVYDVSAGEGGVLVSASRQLTREGVYNAVVASGEGTDSTIPARAVAADLNPASPTYFFGRFGKVPQYFSSPLITSTGQAQAAANTLLRSQLGLPYNVDFNTVPNPALEPHDPIRIRVAAREAPEIHILETLTVPLTAEAAMSATTREQTTVLIGAPS